MSAILCPECRDEHDGHAWAGCACGCELSPGDVDRLLAIRRADERGVR